jgi:flagellar basal body-associated protein FliL
MIKDEKKNDKGKVKDGLNKRLVILLAVSIILLLLGAYLLVNYEPRTKAEQFYHDRKSVEYHQEYLDSQSNKKKAESNIFLQN